MNLTNLQEDVKLLKDMNMDAFRFSIAWTRILPSEYSQTHNLHLIIQITE